MHDLLEQYILKNNIYYHYNIVPGHTKVKVNWKKNNDISYFATCDVSTCGILLFLF